MRTVSFYSYKGGTGRTLLVANVGVLLARLGMSVVLIDLDLEAPGLPYKFPSEIFTGPGVIEWMTAPQRPAVRSLFQPVRLRSPFVPDGSLHLITASEKPSRRYLQAMRQIQEGPLSGNANEAASSLLDLKEAIFDSVAPDFLLIDSRTGITTTNAITTRVLADDVVALTLKTDEQLDGTREVLRSLVPLKRPLDAHSPMGLYVLISRVSRSSDVADYVYNEAEKQSVRTVERFLTEPAVPLRTTVTNPRISLLHNDAEVAEREELLMSRDDALSSRPLHLDYLAFCRQLVGESVDERIETALGAAISENQHAAWMRFFGRAEALGEWGVPTLVPETLFSEHKRAQPIAITVAELRRTPAHTPAQKISLAQALHDYGKALLEAGKLDEARTELIEAVDLYRSVLADPSARRVGSPNLEAALIGQALALVTLSDVEKSDEDLSQAIATLHEALEVVSAVSNPSADVRELKAQISSMQAILLTQAGDLEAAARGVEHSLSVLMPRWRPDLRLDAWYQLKRDPHRRGGQGVATMLGLLAHIHMQAGELTRAVRAAQDSTAVWRLYLKDDADKRDNVSVAKSLNNLGNYLRVAHRQEEAETALKEAVDILRPLAADDPTNLPALATALESLAAVYGELGRSGIALSTAEHALHFRRDIVELSDEPASQLALASALNNVSAQYGALEMHEEAAQRAHEAVNLLGDIPASSSQADLFVAALNNLALSSYRAGDIDTALQSAQTAVAQSDRLSAGSVDWRRSQTARALLNLSLIYRGAERHTEAADAARKAVGVARPLSSTDPELYANCLAVLSSRLVAIGRYQSAVDSARLAVSEYRMLAAKDDQYVTTLAAALDVLATALSRMGDSTAAADASAEAQRIFRSALREFPPDQ
ncbi:KGGVGR-motif variant AAA ATPase [Mycobacterium marinum]|uniref:KGGVGR-motif variant AAA ATPase n=1 Tax=Mycobacterium marinum TaxID=1781 RepID=UPI0035662E19